MDINLPLILFLAVAGTGIVWLIDIALFQGSRRLATAAVDSEYEAMSEEEKLSDDTYRQAIERVASEPVLVEYSKSFFPVLLVVFVLRSFVVEPFQIPSESMVPTLQVGDFILVNKFVYGVRLPLIRKKVVNITEPKRGDVMVFFPPHEKRYFIKRVIGLPGDTIRLADNVLFINGERQDQAAERVDSYQNDTCTYGNYMLAEEKFGDDTHTMRKCVTPARIPRVEEWTVPEGHYFMMGDNRDNSSDSRVWGPVPEERIVGKAFAIWMHWESFVSVPSFSRVGSI
ncbi:MAG: signal peptidase I [Agarilytica sp.]